MRSRLFRLEYGNDLVLESNKLKDIWYYIRMNINEPRKYDVVQRNRKGQFEFSVTAYYLVENFKHKDSLPKLLSDIFISTIPSAL